MSGESGSKDGHFPLHIQEAITSVLTKLLPSNVEPMLSAPYLRRNRGRPRLGVHITGGKSRYLQLKEQRTAALSSEPPSTALSNTTVSVATVSTAVSTNAVSASSTSAAAWVNATSVVDGVPVRRGRGRPRKFPLPSVVQPGTALPILLDPTAVDLVPVVQSIVQPEPVVVASPPPPSPPSAPIVADEPILEEIVADDQLSIDDMPDDDIVDSDVDVDDESSDTEVVSSASEVEATTCIVIPPEASYAAMRRLNVARNREMLAQLAIAKVVSDVVHVEPTPQPTPPPPSQQQPRKEPRTPRVAAADTRDDHYRAPPRRSTSARKTALCGNAACTGFCSRCVSRVNKPIGAAFASETAPSTTASGNALTILAPIEGEELDKGSVSSCAVAHSIGNAPARRGALHGYVMLVQVTSPASAPSTTTIFRSSIGRLSSTTRRRMCGRRVQRSGAGARRRAGRGRS
jgi:hypothetical protein